MSEWKLRYNRPASGWSQGLPLGNGRLGAVVHGGTDSEIWNVTETTYWSGKYEPVAEGGGKAALQAMRERFFAGDYTTGEALAQEALQPPKGNFGTNLALCDVIIRFDHAGTDYTRELDLEQATMVIAYESEGTAYKREVLASHPDGVIAARLTSGRADGLIFQLRLEGRTSDFTAAAEGADTIVFRSRAIEEIHSDGTCGVSGEGRVKVIARGGTVRTEDGALVVQGAEEALVLFAANTDYGRSDGEWAGESARQVEAAEAKGYDRLRADHVADYRELYGRVRVELGDSDRAGLPTDERMRLLRDGRDDDPQLYALFYQYGRYLTIAGSRADSPLPMHLQGIWNDGEASRMAWSCDYHLDVNTEMNYYPTEAANLAECHEPLMRFVGRLAEAGREAAAKLYGSEGWVAHVFTNAWGFASPGWYYSWGLNVTGGLWLAAHLREHYEYALDDAFLREQAYPVLKEAAAFFLDYMTVHPRHGWLVTGPSNSPENSFFLDAAGQERHTLSMGPTMDQVLVRDLFEFCLEAAERLGVDGSLRERLKTAIALLPPLQIGAGGQLQEWLEDFGEAEPDHRHLSHLFALYPGSRITPEEEPALSDAARTTLESRMRGENLEDVEFTLALFAAGFARLHDGEGAYRQLSYLIGQLCFDNLLTFSKAGIAGAEANIFVVDGNFGGTAAIGEMLLQSRPGVIRLLPALPEKWRTGRADGLRAKGGAEVSMAWADGLLTGVTVRAHAAGRAELRYGALAAAVELEPGGVYSFDGALRPSGR